MLEAYRWDGKRAIRVDLGGRETRIDPEPTGELDAQEIKEKKAEPPVPGAIRESRMDPKPQSLCKHGYMHCLDCKHGMDPDPLPLATGTKYDDEKPRLALLPPRALLLVAQGMTRGAKKYGAYNWTNGISYSRLFSAALRHLFAFWIGEDIDSESGLPHLAHAGCCVLMLIETVLCRKDLDDREPHFRALPKQNETR